MDSHQTAFHSFSISKHENFRLQNNVHVLNSRELGNKKIINTSDILAMKASQLHKTQQLVYCDHPIISVNFVKSDGDEPYIISACNWQQTKGLLYFIKLNFRPKISSKDCPPLVAKLDITDPRCTLHPIKDACYSKVQNSQQEIVAYITKTHYVHRKSNIIFHVMGDNEVELLYAVNSHVHSCTFSPVKERFVAGGEKKLFIYESLQFSRSIDILETPSALEFDETGNVVYIGDDQTGLRIEDLREPPARPHTVCHSGMVSQIRRLSDNNTMVLGGQSLIKIDLRSRDVLLKYSGADVNGQRLPFNISEKAGILCSTGLNNQTKLWSLSTPQELCTFTPNSSSPTKSCIVSNDCNWGVALFQNDIVHIFEP